MTLFKHMIWCLAVEELGWDSWLTCSIWGVVPLISSTSTRCANTAILVSTKIEVSTGWMPPYVMEDVARVSEEDFFMKPSHCIIFSAISSRKFHALAYVIFMKSLWLMDSKRGLELYSTPLKAIWQSHHFLIPWWGHWARRSLNLSKYFENGSSRACRNWLISFLSFAVLYVEKNFLIKRITNSAQVETESVVKL